MTTATSGQVTFSVTAAPGIPAWVQALAVGEWAVVPSSNTLTNVQAASAARNVVEAWGCACASSSGDVYLWGGGHGDYSGNEVYRLRLNQATPIWNRLNDPSSPVTEDASYNPDGKPTSRHTYQSHWFANGKLVSLGGAYTYRGGTGDTSNVDVFDPVTLTWNTNVADGGNWLACGDHATGLIYSAAPSGSSSFTYRSMSPSYVWTTLGNDGTYTSFAGAAFDSVRQRIYRIGGYDALPVRYWQIGTGGADPALSGSAASQFDSAGTYPGVDYDSQNDCILLKSPSGAAVYRLNCSTLACDTYVTSGVTPAAAVNGVNGRFKYLPSLKGFVYIPAWGNAYFLKTGS